MKKWRSKRTRYSTLPNSSDLTTVADLPLDDDDKISIPEFYMNDLCSPASDLDACRMSDIQALFRPGEITGLSMKIFNIISTPPPPTTEPKVLSITSGTPIFGTYWNCSSQLGRASEVRMRIPRQAGFARILVY